MSLHQPLLRHSAAIMHSGRDFNPIPPPSHSTSVILPQRAWNDHDCPTAINIVSTRGQHDRALALVNKMYAWRGYGNDHTLPEDRIHTTFTAIAKDETIGTITLALDSDHGLAADETFRDEIDRLRQTPGTELCELTKFAFDAVNSSKFLLASLFHIVYLVGTHNYRCTDLVIEANPRHKRFYEAMLGFKSIGDVRKNPKVDAPSQLLHIKVSEIQKHISEKTREIAQRACSLYPYFLLPEEECFISRKLSI